MIYKICFKSKTIQDNNVIWFQYRILYKILGTKEYLKRINLSLESDCNLCKRNIQDVKHLFAECPSVVHLWENLGKWIQLFSPVNLCFQGNKNSLELYCVTSFG